MLGEIQGGTQRVLHRLESSVQKSRRQWLRVVAFPIILLLYLFIAIIHSLALLFGSNQDAFLLLYQPTVDKGYTTSYTDFMRRKHRIRLISATSFAITIVLSVVMNTLITNVQPVYAATCNISVDTTIDQLYIDTNSCGVIHITANSVLTFSGAIDLASTGTFYVDNGVTATFSGAFNLSDPNDNLQIDGVVTHANGNSTGVNITAQTVTISSTGSINVNSKGCQPDGGNGPGAGPNGSNVCTVSTAGFGNGNNNLARGGGGAGYGGAGGTGSTQGGGTTYGVSAAPGLQGSSGGSSSSGAKGGAGGGLVKLVVAGTLTLDGPIRANGGNGLTNGTSAAGGGGSGGAIHVTAGTLSGSSLTFSATGGNGGHGTSQDGGGGGGGVIALIYTSGTPSLSAANFLVAPGTAQGAAVGGIKGTSYVKSGSSPTATITIYNGYAYDSTDFNETSFTIDSSATNQYCASSAATPSITAATVVLNGNLNCTTASVTSFNVSASSSFTVADNLNWSVTASGAAVDWNLPAGSYVWNGLIYTGGPEALFTINDAVSITLSNTSVIKANAKWTNLDNLIIDNGSSINANSMGCRGVAAASGTGPNGSNVCSSGTAGAGTGANNNGGKGGAGHGGVGGAGAGGITSTGGVTYDSSTAPVLFGSSGGGAFGQAGGNGGGIIRLDVTNAITLNGGLFALGGNGKTDAGIYSGGGGSGGSIYITTAVLNGTPTSISANGGIGGNGTNDGGGGGAGIVSLNYTSGSFTHNASTVSVGGGIGPDAALDGTQGIVYVKQGASPNATVTIYYGFAYDDTDYSEATFTIDPSATNQYCITGTVNPSITAATVNLAGLIKCNVGTLASFNVSASTAFSIANGTNIDVSVKGVTVDFNIPVGSNQTWTNFVLTGGPQGDFTVDDAVGITLASTTINSNINFSNLTSFSIDAGSTINANQKGCVSTGSSNGSGPNTSTNVCTVSTSGFGTGNNGGAGAAGGAYGGAGGIGTTVSTISATYGSPTAPTLFGSSGGNATSSSLGGTGGGRVRIHTTTDITLNGTITANGGNGATNGGIESAGGGSGGSVYLSTNGTFAASTASLAAAGGSGGVGSSQKGGGGGGGRIALSYVTGTPTLSAAVFNLNGGTATAAAIAGSTGTAYVKKGTSPNADITLYQGFTYDDTDYVEASWTADASATNQYCAAGTVTPSVTAAAITLGGTLKCNVNTITSFNVSASTSFSVASGTTFQVTAKGATVDFNIPTGNNQTWNTFSFTGAAQGDFTIDDTVAISLVGSTIAANANWKNLTSLTVDGTSSINADGKGCVSTGTSSGSGPNTTTNVCGVGVSGYGVGNNTLGGMGGAGMGGSGGAGTTQPGGSTYGSATVPVLFGSSGGNASSNQLGGSGGGKLRLDVSGLMTLNGTLSASGLTGATNNSNSAGGSGSGGSIYVTAGTLAGSTGTVTAAGGVGANGSTHKGGGGGGGRVSFKYGVDSSAWLSGLTAATVAPGGSATAAAVAGSTGTLNSTVLTAPTNPTITSPANAAINQNRNLTVSSSAYASDGLAQSSTDWQISDDNTFSNSDCSDSNIVFCAMNSAAFTALPISAGNGTFQGVLNGKTALAPNTTYYVRVRHNNSAGNSAWSASISFTTVANAVPNTPSNSAPGNSATGVSFNPTLSSSGYSETDGDAQLASDWRLYETNDCSGTPDWVANGSNFFTNIVVNSSNGTFGDALSGQSRLRAHTVYSFKVRHNDIYGGQSNFSTCTSFTTTNTAPSLGSSIPDQNLVEDNSVAAAFNLNSYITDADFNDNGNLTCVATNGLNAGLGTLTIQSNGSVDFALVSNANGTDTIQFSCQDSAGSSVLSNTVNVTITSVNDAPSFTKGTNQTVNEDVGAQTVAGWATAISKGPSDEAGQTLNFTVSNDNNALFSAQPAVDVATGQLTYTPAANANGSATVSIHLSDSGGTTNGGVDTTVDQTFTITVNAVNDAPSFTKGTNQTVNEDAGAQTVAGWATNLSVGPSNEAGQTVLFTVVADDATLFSSQPSINPATGDLTFTPANNAYGVATISVSLSDNGGTTNGGANTSAIQTFSISITAINDAPSFTKGTNQTVNEDVGAQTVAGWATNLNKGSANEASQALTFYTSNNNNALFSIQPAVTPTGELSYTPAINANGSATVSIHVSDDGGILNGGIDTSVDQTFTISVTPVNDAPSFTPGTAITLAEDSGAQSLSNWATGITAGPSDESAQTTSFTVTNNNQALFSAQPTLTNNGTLSFTSSLNQFGTATISITLKDNGGTANAGLDTAVAQTVSITITPVNDAPVLSYLADQTVPEGTTLQVTWHATDVDGDATTLTASDVKGNFAANNLRLADLFADQRNGSGVFTWTPGSTLIGDYVLRVTASDGNAVVNADVKITVEDSDQNPVFSGQLPVVSILSGTTTSQVFDLDDYFSDPEGEALTFGSTTPTVVTIDVDVDHQVSITAPADYVGSEQIIFTATDPLGQTAVSNSLEIVVNSDSETIDLAEVSHVRGSQTGAGQVLIIGTNGQILANWQAYPVGGVIPRIGVASNQVLIYTVKNRSGSTMSVYSLAGNLQRKKRVSPKVHWRRLAVGNLHGSTTDDDEIVTTTRRDHSLYFKVYTYHPRTKVMKLERRTMYKGMRSNDYSVTIAQKAVHIVNRNGKTVFDWKPYR